MSAKISAAKQAAFLKALFETGNQTLAVERAKVSRGWVTLHRGRDADFDAAVRAAVKAARERLLTDPHPPTATRRAPPSPACGRGASNKPGRGWAFAGGEELVVRGTRSGPRGASARRVQIGRARLKQWTARTEDRFLAALAVTCNVKMACAEVGLTQASAYNHRNRWAAFAAAWDAVVERSEVELEAAQIECARCVLEGMPVPPDNPIREMSAGEAIYLLEMFHRRREGHPRRWGRRAWVEPPIEKVRAEVLRKVAAMERAGRSGGAE
jgi:hypothetical protein